MTQTDDAHHFFLMYENDSMWVWSAKQRENFCVFVFIFFALDVVCWLNGPAVLDYGGRTFAFRVARAAPGATLWVAFRPPAGHQHQQRTPRRPDAWVRGAPPVVRRPLGKGAFRLHAQHSTSTRGREHLFLYLFLCVFLFCLYFVLVQFPSSFVFFLHVLFLTTIFSLFAGKFYCFEKDFARIFPETNRFVRFFVILGFFQ